MSIVTARAARRRAAALVALIALALWWPAVAETSEDDARRAARTFGSALLTSDAAALRPILPSNGKVRVDLRRLGPEDGLFGAGQVEALFKDFLSTATVRSFDVVRLESDGRSSALARARAVLVDREGRPGRVTIHLAFQPEDGRWVLREVKETAE